MYLSHWNLREQPFQNVADARFAYLSDQHQEGLARLIYLVKNRKLGGVLIGDYGVGKSMILELLACNDATGAATRFVPFDAPPGGAAGLARQVLSLLDTGKSFEDVGATLETIRSLTSNPRSGFPHTTLAIDEAHLIADAGALEFLHRLTNFRLVDAAGRPNSPAFTLILAGHAQLEAQVNRETALRQRLSMVWHLDPLNARQTGEYVEYRMRSAGGDIWVFEEGTLDELAAASGGVPRVINNICDVALMLGFSLKAPRVTRTIMRQAIDDVCLLSSSGNADTPQAEHAP